MTTDVATSGEMSPTVRHIARVAARLFAERGYEATAVREICEASGITKPTLYYYFRSKEGLARALITLPLTELVSVLTHLVTTAADPLAGLESVIDAQYVFYRDDPDRGRFIYSVLFGLARSDLAVELEPLRDSLISWTESAVRRLAEADIVPRPLVEACSAACRGLVLVSTVDFLYRDRPLGGDLARRQVEDLLRGFATPRQPAPIRRDNGRGRAAAP